MTRLSSSLSTSKHSRHPTSVPRQGCRPRRTEARAPTNLPRYAQSRAHPFRSRPERRSSVLGRQHDARGVGAIGDGEHDDGRAIRAATEAALDMQSGSELLTYMTGREVV